MKRVGGKTVDVGGFRLQYQDSLFGYLTTLNEPRYPEFLSDGDEDHL